MNLKEAFEVKPGDRVIYKNGPVGEIQVVQSSWNWLQEGIEIVSGLEYIVSSVKGFSKSGKQVLFHYIKDKGLLFANKEDPLVKIYFELEMFDDTIPSDFFEKFSEYKERTSVYTSEDLSDEKIHEIIQPWEVFVELADKKSKFNAYNILINDYVWYLQEEIKRTKNNDMDFFEDIYAMRLEELEKKEEINMSEEYSYFKKSLEIQKNYFEGTKKVCEVLASKYNIDTYGNIIKRFANNGVTLKDIKLFYDKGWLGKKEFQQAIICSYNQLKIDLFAKYEW
ncbi:hypothetical protein K9M74_01665 [Candidatus Woesearchaeota archaeon]|nr:hypothetical protein [Candidatus Woesearchaeota archaeon]